MGQEPADALGDGGTTGAEPAPAALADASGRRTVRFGPSIEPHHRRLDPAQIEDLYVVGDVHGCIEELRTLWDRLDPGTADRVVFVGDLVRKGPDSRAVVEFVADRENAISVRGNNEAKLLRGTADPPWAPAVVDAIADFPLAVSWGHDLVVHGGLRPQQPLAEHRPDDLLETRAIPPGNGYDGPFWFDLHVGPPRVFFGHTVLDAPIVEDWAVGLDTGCVYGGSLTAYDCRGDRLLRVPADATYRDRSHEKIIEP